MCVWLGIHQKVRKSVRSLRVEGFTRVVQRVGREKWNMDLAGMGGCGRGRMSEMRNLSKVRPNTVETSRWVDRQTGRQTNRLWFKWSYPVMRGQRSYQAPQVNR